MTTQSRPAGPRGSSSPGGRPGGGGGGGGFRRGRPRYFTRRKVCAFCVNHVKYIDYKEANALGRYLSDQAKIESRRKSGVCSKHQRGLATAIKRARHMAMMPMSRNHLTSPARGGSSR